MLKPFAILCLCAVALFAVVAAIGYSSCDGHPKPKSESAQTEQQDAKDCPSLNSMIKLGLSRIGGFIHEYREEIVAVGTIFIAAFTIILGIATAALYQATRDLVKGDEDTAKRQLRAYVAVKIGPVTNFGPDTEAQITIAFQNYGQTPAIDLRANCILFPRQYPLREKEDLTIPVDQKLIQVTKEGRGVTLHPRDVYFGSVLKREINQGVYQGIKSGEIIRLYAFGQVDYKDIFGVLHWTHFCYSFHGEGPTIPNWEACPRYNDTDKN